MIIGRVFLNIRKQNSSSAESRGIAYWLSETPYSRVGLAPQRVGEGVNTEGCLMNDEHSTHASIHQTSPEVIPAKSGERHRENERKANRDWQVILVLPHYEFVLVQICDIDTARAPLLLLKNHPAEMRVPKALVNCIRVLRRKLGNSDHAHAGKF